MAGSSIGAPEFDGIRRETGQKTEDALRLLWVGLNDTRTQHSRLLEQVEQWKPVPYLAGNFTANSGTWTVEAADHTLYQYTLTGKVLVVQFTLVNTTSSSGMGSQLRIALPAGLKAASASYTGTLFTAGDISEAGKILTLDSGTGGANLLSLQRAAGSNWPSSVTNDLDIRGMIALEVS
ncbi:hypothetical protein [uncultured Mediterranean phage]|jgi:hypothetical protein|nr:hypothetical protein [uncultured Mediterranean phage]